MREIRQGQFYRHFKDRLYQIIAVATHSETGEQMVVYQALYGDYKVYVRPYEMFLSEVDHEKYPEVQQKYRFELVEFSGQEVPKEEEIQKCVEEAGKADVETGSEQKAVDAADTETGEYEGVNPILLEFLDAETMDEKMHIMSCRQKQMDEALLTSIAISLDLVVEKKSIQEKYMEIMNCLSMKKHFERTRR